ncbi:MAG: hypothetical protein HY010_07060 [Acidobacteria bacterium]|nr:hypothetical protein [Acidobacteriota bacterium]
MSRLGLLRKLRQEISLDLRFSRPLILLQSDDWGRVGVRDAEGREDLQAAGIHLGERPYDLYSLETSEDVHELTGMLQSLRDSVGEPPSLEMNFLVANVDFQASAAAGFRDIVLKPLVKGLPGRWTRPGLLEAYRDGIRAGVLVPAMHGTTHFCQQAVAHALTSGGEREELLRTLWKAETPYIHWRMPWVGYEYWDPEKDATERFISEKEQKHWIEWAAASYRELFVENAVSVCAPGYRAASSTHRLWKEQGIRIAQNGPGKLRAPHWDEHGLLHTYRSMDFEPAVNVELRWEECVKDAARWFGRGLPLIVSVHSINFHSTLAPFRQKTLPVLREFLSALHKSFPDLLYVNSRQLLEIVETGSYQSENGRVAVTTKGKPGVRP